MLLKSGKFRLNKTAVRFFITYIVILAITLIISITSSQKAKNVIISNTVESTQTALEQTSNVVSGYMQQAQKTATSVYLDSYLTILKTNSKMENSLSHFYLTKLYENMGSYTSMDDLYIGVFAYIHNYDYAISPKALYSYDGFYNTYFTYGDMSEDEWFELIKNTKYASFLPSEEVMYKNYTASTDYVSYSYRAITLIFPISTARGDDSKGEIVLLINEELISESLNTVDIGSDGWCYILNEDGEIITTLTGENVSEAVIIDFEDEFYSDDYYTIDGKKMLVTTIFSSYNNWQYVSVVPQSYVLSDVFSLEKSNTLLIILALILGSLFSLGFTTLNLRPLRNLVSSLRSGLNEELLDIQNEYEFIKNSFDKVNTKNQTLQRRVEFQLPMMRTAIFENLLNDRYENNTERNEMLKSLNLNLAGASFTIFIVKIAYFPNNFQSMERVRVMVGSEIIKSTKENTLLHYIDDDKIVILYSLKNNASLKIELDSLTQKIVSGLLDQNGIDVIIGIGGIYGDIKNISTSYREALYVIDYLYLGKNVIWYNELNVAEDSECLYNYTQATETHLISAAKSSNIEQINDILKRLYYDNYIAKNLSLKMGKQLISDLYGTALRAMEQIGCIELSDNFDTTSKNLEDSFEDLVNLFEKIAEFAHDKKIQQKTKLVRDLTKYIESEYTNSSITLANVASYFGLSETRLSHLFKDEVGENFSKYIEKKRIELACTMIGKKLIKDIAFEVGYSNELTFSRAFKRVAGVNPSEYNPK